MKGITTTLRRLALTTMSMVASVFAVVMLSACGSGSDSTIDVFAAASLTNGLDEIVVAYERAFPDTRVRVNLAGSSTLREQLRDGADADVFISANTSIMDDLVADGTVTGEPQVLAANTIVLAVPAGNPGNVTGIADLANSSLFVGVCAVGVPCGDLASALLAEAGVDASIDTAEPDAASLVRRLRDAELDAALVYASDVGSANGELELVTIGVDAPATTYPIVAVHGGADAAHFIEFVRSESGAAILRQWGFETP